MVQSRRLVAKWKAFARGVVRAIGRCGGPGFYNLPRLDIGVSVASTAGLENRLAILVPRPTRAAHYRSPKDVKPRLYGGRSYVRLRKLTRHAFAGRGIGSHGGEPAQGKQAWQLPRPLGARACWGARCCLIMWERARNIFLDLRRRFGHRCDDGWVTIIETA